MKYALYFPHQKYTNQNLTYYNYVRPIIVSFKTPLVYQYLSVLVLWDVRSPLA